MTAFEEGRTFTDRQVSGPFGKFEHTHRVEAEGDGAAHGSNRVSSAGGLVGPFLTNDKIRQHLESLAAFRNDRFRELLK